MLGLEFKQPDCFGFDFGKDSHRMAEHEMAVMDLSAGDLKVVWVPTGAVRVYLITSSRGEAPGLRVWRMSRFADGRVAYHAAEFGSPG